MDNSILLVWLMIVLYPFYMNSELFNIQKKTLIQSLYSAPKKKRESIPQEQRRGDWNWRWGEGIPYFWSRFNNEWHDISLFHWKRFTWRLTELYFPNMKRGTRMMQQQDMEIENYWIFFLLSRGRALSSPPWTLTQIYDGGMDFTSFYFLMQNGTSNCCCCSGRSWHRSDFDPAAVLVKFNILKQ